VKKAILDSATRFPDRMVLQPGSGAKVPFADLSITGGVVNAVAALRLAGEMAAKMN
jgi:hypothetical protein